MQRRPKRYLNEIVSLSVMTLMIVALAAGQAAEPADGAEAPTTMVAEHDSRFRHDGE